MRDRHPIDSTLPRSLWAATAVAAPPTRPLQGERRAEVVVVGAGFTGLSAALALAEAGRDVVVLEAAEAGWGASGRNNGQVIPGLKLDPDRVASVLGEVRAERLVAFAGGAPDEAFALVRRHAIACDALQAGWIQPAYTAAAVPIIAARCRQWAARGAPVEMAAPERLAGLLGTDRFKAAWLDRRGGSLNPLSYARGLAMAAQRAEAELCTATPVTGLERRDGLWRATTPGGAVLARHCVVATNAYGGDLVPGLARSIVPLRTAQVATQPLSANIAATILPGRQAASDARRLLTSFRVTPEGRLVMGGSDATAGAEHPGMMRRLHRAADELFGHLGPLRWDYGWSGYLALTSDHLPHLHEPAPGLIIGLGYNGRGIALATALGRAIAERVQGCPAEALPLPVSAVTPIPCHAWRGIGIAAATRMKRLLDAVDRRR